MKTDPVLLRAILQYAEDNADCGESDHVLTAAKFTEFAELTDKLLHHHIKLCAEANFLEIKATDRIIGNCLIPYFKIIRLTWEGNRFLKDATHPGFVDWDMPIK